MKKILLVVFLLLVLSPVVLLAYLGFLPGFSNLLGTNKPRDLGVKWTEVDRISVHQKSGVKFASLPSDTSPENSLQRTGGHAIKTEFTSAEISATMADRNWRHWPYKDVQMKFNRDGSVEVSGKLLKNRLPGYAAAIGIPKEAVEFAMKFLPADPVFYVKGTAALRENRLAVFAPEALEIGRMPIPLGPILSVSPDLLFSSVYAADLSEIGSELSGINNKKALIMEYIHNRLSLIKGFYAKEARFDDNRLIFEGSLPDTIHTLP